MSEHPDDELRELIALAAVGALDTGERAALEVALADRPDLLAELADLEAVAATLADATAEAPPDRLRARVLDAIGDVPQVAAAPDVARPAAPVVALDARRRRWAPLAAAAAVVAILAGGLVVRTLVDDDDTMDVAAVVDDDGAVTYPLGGTVPMRVIHSPDLGAMVLVADAVPPPEGDQVYELWMITDGEPHRMDIFRPRDDGSVEMLMVDMEMPDGAQFAVTVEPAGGMDAPTGDVVAASS